MLSSRIRRPIALAAIGIAVPLATTACGSLTPDEQSSIDAVRAFHRALAHGDGNAACALLTPAARSEYSFPGVYTCQDGVASLHRQVSSRQWDALQHINIRHVTVRGDRAVIRDEDVEFPSELADNHSNDGTPTILRRVNGRWLLDQLG